MASEEVYVALGDQDSDWKRVWGLRHISRGELPRRAIVELVSPARMLMRSNQTIWAGLDLGAETTSVCIVNDVGEILHQSVCPTRLECIHEEIQSFRRRLARISLEATSSFNLARGLQSLGYSVDLYETRQLSKFLRVRRNKTDAGDAVGIAEVGRLGGGLLSKVFLKSFECQVLQSRLTIRRLLVTHRVATMNLLGRQIEHYGGRLTGSKISLRFASQVEVELRRVFGTKPTPLAVALRDLLERWRQLRTDQIILDRELDRFAKSNDVCRRFMEIPGIGPICALAFYAAVGEPHRFTRSADIGAYFGLTPRIYQSGATRKSGRISRMGNKTVRTMLTRAACAVMRSSARDSELRDWAKRLAERRGHNRAKVALARKLAVIMIAMWKNGQCYRSNSTETSSPSLTT